MKTFLLLIVIIVGISYLGRFTKDEAPRRAEEAPKVQFSPEQIAEKKKQEDEWKAYVISMRTLKSAMKNPDSFKLQDVVRMMDGTLCVVYRATNSFNAIVPGHAVITKQAIVTSDNGDRFQPLWQKHCNGKTGINFAHIRHAL